MNLSEIESVISAIKCAIYEAKGDNTSRILKEQAEYLSDYALGFKPYPQICFELIVDFLSNRNLFEKRGAGHFVFEVLTDLYKFDENQRGQLVSVIESNFKHYNDSNLCRKLCLAIVLNYKADMTVNLFRSLYPQASRAGKIGIALALNIIVSDSPLNSHLVTEISIILASGDLNA